MKVSLSVLLLASCITAAPHDRRRRGLQCFNADGTPMKDNYVDNIVQANAGVSKPTIVPHPDDGNPASLIAAIASGPSSTPGSPPKHTSANPAAPGAFHKWPLENGCHSAHNGDGTVFDFAPGQYLACGVEGASEAENWFAVSWMYPEWSSEKSICGKEFVVSYKGKTTKGKLYDKCSACKKGDIDLSRKMWNDLTNEAYPDRFKMQWWPAAPA